MPLHSGYTSNKDMVLWVMFSLTLNPSFPHLVRIKCTMLTPRMAWPSINNYAIVCNVCQVILVWKVEFNHSTQVTGNSTI